MIDPGDNTWTRWIDSLKPGDNVETTSGKRGIFQHWRGAFAIVMIGRTAWRFRRTSLTQPAPPALLARKEEE